MKHYRTSGVELFARCLGPPPLPLSSSSSSLVALPGGTARRVRLLTVLRHPVERLFSAISFFASAKHKGTHLKEIFGAPRHESLTGSKLRSIAMEIAARFPGTECSIHQVPMDFCPSYSIDSSFSRFRSFST